MKGTKKVTGALISLLLAVSIIAGFIPLAFAAQAEPAESGQEDFIEWNVSFNKASYFLFDKVTATVEYKNISGSLLFTAFAAKSESLEYLSSDYGALILGAGEAGKAVMEFQLSSNAPGLNFFARLLLKIRDLFKKGNSLEAVPEAMSVYEAEADFGWNGKQPVKFCLNYEAVKLQEDEPDDPEPEEKPAPADFFEDLEKTDAYTLRFVMKSTSEGQTVSMPVTVAKDAEKMFVEATAPLSAGNSMTVTVYINGDKARAYIPTIRAYMDIPAEEIRNFTEEFRLGIESPEEAGYKGTYNTSLGGKKYKVDIYESDSGRLCYYYEGNNLKKIEYKGVDGSESVVEITEFTDSADSKLFEEPTGYVNISSIVKEG